ncbi:hypothetical protein CDAR_417141 [Caerostris darwini]|uniref:Uncharacterized protein n=1 Tax=Caerostris darwini TaxID=1538125 RepID=A0AAV4X589_9ARAC|nr:hypothetical protein CDAR_417141 [Caerostris darwini]
MAGTKGLHKDETPEINVLGKRGGCAKIGTGCRLRGRAVACLIPNKRQNISTHSTYLFHSPPFQYRLPFPLPPVSPWLDLSILSFFPQLVAFALRKLRYGRRVSTSTGARAPLPGASVVFPSDLRSEKARDPLRVDLSSFVSYRR